MQVISSFVFFGLQLLQVFDINSTHFRKQRAGELPSKPLLYCTVGLQMLFKYTSLLLNVRAEFAL